MVDGLAILASESSWYFKQLADAAGSLGVRVKRLGFPELTLSSFTEDDPSGFSTPDCESVIVRTMPLGSLEQVIFRMDVLRAWENSGVRVFNSPLCLETSIDKLLSLEHFSRHSVPIPRTCVCQTAEQAFDAFEKLGQDVVVKPIFGGEGRGIIRVSDLDMAHRVFQALERTQSVIYCQEFLNNVQKDIRILFVGDQSYSIQRQNGASWKSNASFGGSGTTYQPTSQELDMAFAAKKSVGGQIVGVDILLDSSGRYSVLEVNAVPGWKLLQKVTGVDIAKEIIQLVTRHG